MNYMNQNQMMPGVQYAKPMVKGTQPLTAEQVQQLRSNGGTKLEITDTDLLASVCTHRDPQTNQPTLIAKEDGSQYCTICNARFNLVEYSAQEVEMLTRQMVDVLQSIKTYYLDIPVNVAKEFFVILPLLEKVPMLYNIALHQFEKFENGGMVNQNGYVQSFGLLNTLTNPTYGVGGMMPGMMQQNYMDPMMQQQQMQQQMMQQQQMQQMGQQMQQPTMPGMNNNMGMPQNSIYNQQPYSPGMVNNNPFTNNGTATQQPVAQQQNQSQPTAEVTVTKNFTA